MYLRSGKNFSSYIRSTLIVLVFSATGMSEALALPSFARQTGEACDACHVGAYGPQLTAHGMKFKLGGYTESDGKDGHIPLAAMLIENYTHTAKDQDPPPEDLSKNNNLALQELSGFVAGKLYDGFGAFAQVTYSDIDKATALDNTELRYATETTLLGQEGTFGVTVNNNPAMQDPFNTLPAWRFPYTSSDLAPGPEAGPLLDDMIAGTVMGVTAYAQLNNGVYAELGNYSSLSNNFLGTVNVDPGPEVNGLAPYWRVAYFKDKRAYSYSVGVVGMSAELRDRNASGAGDKFADYGIDGHYQFLGNRMNIFSVNGSYLHEARTVADEKSNLDQLNIAGSYYYDKSYGGTVRYFSTADDSSAKLDTTGLMLQADWSPFGKESSWQAPLANLRLGLQYTEYNKLNGVSSNASDANTLMAFAWASL